MVEFHSARLRVRARTAALVALAFAALPHPRALAQDDPAVFKKPEAAVEKDDLAHGKVGADLGVLVTAGNAFTASVASGFHLEVRRQKNRFRTDFVGNFALGDANGDGKLVWDDDLSAFHLQADLRYDRFVTERTSLYLLGGAFHDPFQHLVLRPHAQVGVSRSFVVTTRHLLVGELGADYAVEMYGYYKAGEVLPAVDPLHIVAARLYAKYQYSIATNLTFSQELEGLPGVTNDAARRFAARLNSVSALNVQLAAGIGIKLGLGVGVNFTPPPETKRVDIAGTVNLVAARAF
ncbi:DUF481 domain-containing protein [Myxococcota bacterium]|nr:DUF481 domain-containing protein [Myxococcota bacterium]